MNIKVFQNRKIEKDYFYNEGTQNENKSTVLTFEVPLGYEDFSKRIVFITEDGNFWDYIPENKYEIKNNITKYGEVEAYLWLTKDDQDFRSQNFELNFYDNENADDLVPTEEEIDGFATLIAELDLKIAEVEALKVDIGDFQKALNSKASKEELKEVDNKFNNYYLKSETYDKTEIDNKISVIPKFNRIVVDELPTENIQEDAIYLIPSQGDTNDLYREYIYINGKWELIGIQKGDLSNIYTKQEVDEMVREIQETNEYQSEIIDQFKNEFKQITVSGDSIYIPDAAELPMELVPYGEPVQTVIEEELGTTVEGESVVVSGGNPEKEVKDVIYGMSKQETTEGYNLCPTNVDDWELGQYSATGVLDNVTTRLRLKELIKIEPNNVYFFNLYNDNYKFVMRYYDENKAFLSSYGAIDNGNAITTPEGSSYISMTIYNPSSSAGTEGQAILDKIANGDIKPLICLNANSLKGFEPYTGGQASPNTGFPQDIEVIDTVNEFDKTKVVNGYFNANGEIISNSVYRISDYICLNKKNIYISGNYGGSEISAYYDENKNFISTINIGTRTEFGFEVPSNAKYIRCTLHNSVLDEYMVTQGTSKLPYLPYGHIGLKQRGKNRLKFKETTTQTNSGLTGTANVDGSFNLNGTTTGTVAMGFNLEPYKVKGTHRASGYTKDGLVQLYWKEKNGTVKYKEIRETTPINFEEGDTLFQVFCWTNFTGKTYNNETFYLQLEEGSEATPFETPVEPIVHSIDLAGEKLAKVGEIADLLNIGVDGSVSIEKKTSKDILDGVTKLFVTKGNATNNNIFLTNAFNTKIKAPSSNSTVEKHLSNYFRGNYSTNYLYSNNLQGSSIRSDKVFGIAFGLDSEVNTLELANTFLKEHSVEIIAPLEEQYYETIPLPSIEPITLFEGITNVFELVTNLGTTMALTYDYVTPSPSIDRPSEILTVKGSYDTELKNEDASIINKLPLTLTKELLGEIVTLTEEEAKQLNLDGAGKYRRTDYGRYVFTGVETITKSGHRFVYFISPELIKGSDTADEISSIICNKLIARSPNETYLKNNGISVDADGYIRIYIDEKENYTADEFELLLKEWYDNGEPLEIIYKLKTPTYEKITDETELEQLSDYDKQIAFFGINNINTYPTDDLVKAPLKIHATYSKSNKLTIQSLEYRLASLESQVTNLQDNQI